MEEKNAIKTIAAIPRNKHYIQYYINSGEKHTAKYDDFLDMIKDHSPRCLFKATEFVSYFEPFIIFIDEQSIVPLSFNEEEEIKKYRKNFFESEFGKPMRKNRDELEEEKIPHHRRSQKALEKLNDISHKLFGE